MVFPVTATVQRPKAGQGYIRSVSFDVSADAYARFIGRFSEPLAERFVQLADVRSGDQALDVGSGPGALTAQLAEVDARSGVAEDLPFADGAVDVALAQLVVHFMTDPAAGLREMARVTRPGGLVSACVWDHASGGGPLATFWQAVHDIDPGARDESGLAGAREGHLAELCRSAGLQEIRSTSLTVAVPLRDV